MNASELALAQRAYSPVRNITALERGWTERVLSRNISISGRPVCIRNHQDIRINFLYAWVSMRSCYHMILDGEQRRGVPYQWILRTRTDIVYLGPLQLPQRPPGDGAVTDHAYIPTGGLTSMNMVCENDHIFLCPRHLCEPYLNMLDRIFLNPHCRLRKEEVPSNDTFPEALRDRATSQRPFFLPQFPSGSSAAGFKVPPARPQWYFYAQYTRLPRGAECYTNAHSEAEYLERSHATAPPKLHVRVERPRFYQGLLTDACCGQIREVPWLYALTRPTHAKQPDKPQWRIECTYGLWNGWRRPSNWANGSAIVLRAGIRRCHELAERYGAKGD